MRGHFLFIVYKITQGYILREYIFMIVITFGSHFFFIFKIFFFIIQFCSLVVLHNILNFLRFKPHAGLIQFNKSLVQTCVKNFSLEQQYFTVVLYKSYLQSLTTFFEDINLDHSKSFFFSFYIECVYRIALYYRVYQGSQRIFITIFVIYIFF